MSVDFADVEKHLHDRGMRTYRQGKRQLVISRQRGPVLPYSGNSFWVCKLAGDWYLSTWSPYYYRVPPESSLPDVCEAFVDVGTEAQCRVPADLMARFGLVETDHDEFDRLWEATGSAE